MQQPQNQLSTAWKKRAGIKRDRHNGQSPLAIIRSRALHLTRRRRQCLCLPPYDVFVLAISIKWVFIIISDGCNRNGTMEILCHGDKEDLSVSVSLPYLILSHSVPFQKQQGFEQICAALLNTCAPYMRHEGNHSNECLLSPGLSHAFYIFSCV